MINKNDVYIAKVIKYFYNKRLYQNWFSLNIFLETLNIAGDFARDLKEQVPEWDTVDLCMNYERAFRVCQYAKLDIAEFFYIFKEFEFFKKHNVDLDKIYNLFIKMTDKYFYNA